MRPAASHVYRTINLCSQKSIVHVSFDPWIRQQPHDRHEHVAAARQLRYTNDNGIAAAYTNRLTEPFPLPIEVAKRESFRWCAMNFLVSTK